MEQLTGDSYTVRYDASQSRVAIAGVLRLNGMAEYAPVAEMLRTALDENQVLTLDLRSLDFLNSSGIAMLSKFVIEVRDRKTGPMTVLGSKSVAWQGKSLVNLKRLNPNLSLELQ